MKQSYPTLYQFVMKKDTEEYFKKKNEHVKPNVNFNEIPLLYDDRWVNDMSVLDYECVV